MATFPALQQLVRQRLTVLGGLQLSLSEMGDEVLKLVDEVVPNEGLRLWLVDPATCLLTRFLASRNEACSLSHHWLSSVYLTVNDERVPYFSTRRVLIDRIGSVSVTPEQKNSLGLPGVVADRIAATLHRSWFDATESPRNGWSYIGLSDRQRWVGLLVTIHRHQSTRLSAGSFHLLQHLQTAIGRLLAGAIQREQAATQAESEDLASGVLLIDRFNTIAQATTSGERWIDLLRDSPRAVAQSGNLPTAIVSACNALRYEQARGTLVPVGRVACITSDGPAMLEATSLGPDGAAAVVITPQRRQPLPTIPTAWHLTLQEERITRLILTGASNRRISEALFISEATVETHLAHIYTKLEINSRTQLANAYFQAVYRA